VTEIFAGEGTVPAEWIDINGHMNVAYYVLAFDLCVDALWSRVGITDEYIDSRQMSTFAVESHITYQRELKVGDDYRIVAQLLAIDEKRVHQFQRMYHKHDGYLAATAEWLNLHVNLQTRRVCPWPEEILTAFVDAARNQHDTALPAEIMRKMRVNKPVFSLAGYCDQRERLNLASENPA